jgi:GAF domain-containing protein
MNTTPGTDLFDRLGRPDRLLRLAGYDIFDPGLRPRLDAVAARSAERLRAPVSMISVLLDSSQFILGQHGVPGWVAEVRGIPAEWSLCSNTVLTGKPYCLANAADDPVYAENPLLAANGVRSYAGVPLIDDSGYALGAHCVIDVAPRAFTEADLDGLHEDAAESLRILAEYRVDLADYRVD